MNIFGVKFEPTTRSAPLGCDAAMKIKVEQKSKKRGEFLEWFGLPSE